MGCHNSGTLIQNCETITIPLPAEFSVNNIDSASAIMLSEKVLLSSIMNGMEINGKIYIIDDKFEDVFVFDLQGNYIDKISDSGSNNIKNVIFDKKNKGTKTYDVKENLCTELFYYPIIYSNNIFYFPINIGDAEKLSTP